MCLIIDVLYTRGGLGCVKGVWKWVEGGGVCNFFRSIMKHNKMI